MSLQGTPGTVGVPQLKHWCVVQMLTLRGVPKLDLMHCSYYYTFFFLFLKKRSTLVNIFLYYKRKFVQFYWEGKFCYIFKKKSNWCPKTWNVSVVVVVVLRSKCIIVCYLLKISPIFLKIIPAHYSLREVFDGTCIYPRGSDRYLHAWPLHLFKLQT